MLLLLGRLIVSVSSLLAPRTLRGRWREEWQGEIAAAARAGATRALRLALGAPFDAISSRWTTRPSRPPRGSGPWGSDLKQTVRSLVRSPGHVAVVALCLGAGIAVCTTTFSIWNTIISGELPGVTERSRIGRLHLSAGLDGPPDFNASAVADYEILRDGSPSFAAMAAEGEATFALRVPGRDAMNVDGAFVSGTYFEVLGTKPYLGRLFLSSDDRPDAPLGVVFSHEFWNARLGAPADIVGRAIVIGGRDAVVVGVAPEGFLGRRGRVYVPLAHARGWPGAPRPRERWLNVYGRLTVPMDRERLAAELQPLAGRIEASDPVERRNARIAVTDIKRTPDATMGQLMFVVMLNLAAPLVVLAIACANVANLQLVRASLRARELAVRVSLGASRGQIIRLLTFEAALLVFAAFAIGAFGIWVLLRVATLAVPIAVHLDARVMLFSAGIAVLVIAATGLLPGLVSTRAAAAAGLRRGGRVMTAGNSRMRRGLVVTQVTLCFLLLLVAALFTRGLSLIGGQVPSDAPHTLVTELRFDLQRNDAPGQRRAFLDAFDARLRADGRVRAIGYTNRAPIRGGGGDARVWRASDPIEAGRVTGAAAVAGDFFNVSGVHVLRGRALTDADAGALTSVVVDETFVRRFKLAEPVVGQSLRLSLSPEEASAPRHVTIVGVASRPLSSVVTSQGPILYLPLTMPHDYLAAWIAADDAGQLTESVRRTIADIDPELPAMAVRTLEDHYADENRPVRLIARAASGLGAVSLVLALSGLYSVIAFFVALRTNEFGVRIALGARSRDIVGMVLGQALRLVGIGLAVGAVLGAPLLMALDSFFAFTEPLDPAVVLPTALVLALTALVAGWVPARKAASIEPAAALRAD